MKNNSANSSTTNPFNLKIIEKFSGRKFIHITEVATKIEITPRAILERSLNAHLPIYLICEKGWVFRIFSGESPDYIDNPKIETDYSLLRLIGSDVAMLFAKGHAEISNFITEDNIKVSLLSNGAPLPAQTVSIDMDKLIILYDDLVDSSDKNLLGHTERKNLLKSIAALAYTTAYFYEKAFENGQLGQSPQIKVSPLVKEVHRHLTENGLSLVGILESALEARISEGRHFLNKE